MISADGTPGVSVAVSVRAYRLVADRTRRPAGAVAISADVLTADPACRIAVPISVGVYGAIAVYTCRITRSIRVKDSFAQLVLCANPISPHVLLMTLRAPIVSVFDKAGKRLVGFAYNSGPRGWLPCNRDGEGIGGPIPTSVAAPRCCASWRCTAPRMAIE